MDARLNIALSHSDFSALQAESKGNLSQKIREILESVSTEDIIAQLMTDKTTCRIDLDLAQKVQEKAEKLGVAPGRVVRAAIEAHLHTHH